MDEGTRLGFHAEANYSSPEDNAVAEAAWLLNPRQKPVFTFTIEEADPMRLAASALQWVGSSTEPKSWVHTCILPSGSADLLSSFLLPKSVIVYDGRSLAVLSHDLEEHVARMVRLLRLYTDDEPGGSIPETVKRLSRLTAEWPKGMWSSRLSLKAQTAFTDEGLYIFAAEGLEDDEADVPVLKPSRKVVPMELTGGGTSFEGALMRLTEARGGDLTFSTEHRNYPFIFRLSARESGGDSTLDLWFDVDKSNIPQALRFRELVEGVVSSKAALLAGSSGEVARLTLS
ncbi:MAG: hypothetical protein NTV61_01230 [Candidatus Bathyarchaeota archaeon]|nr:hypothetical protein [Candidatus Bathyarchaeota archaeon]